MNNFIVGQVTPDMLANMTYGTYIFFGVLTFLGAAFVYFIVPETKGLSLEEMDLLFGSHGLAERENERWKEVHAEIGLGEILARAGLNNESSASGSGVGDEKHAGAGVTETKEGVAPTTVTEKA